MPDVIQMTCNVITQALQAAILHVCVVTLQEVARC